MNQIFSEQPTDAWLKFPRRSFARLDHVEPPDPTQASEAVFSFDALDADWLQQESYRFFPDEDPRAVRKQMSHLWSRLFSAQGAFGPDIFDEMPIYNIEVTARRGDEYWDLLLSFLEEDWIEIELSVSGTYPVEVYAAILAAPVLPFLTAIARVSPATAQFLSAIFDVDAWPDASDIEIDDLLATASSVDKLAMYDVGQGSAVGLLDSADDAKLFFDLGAGSYGNKHTRPKPLRFCWRGSPSIVLSHWDTDHWAGGSSDKAARGRTWLAPRQANLGPRHHAFAGRILKHGGTLLIWRASRGASRTVSIAKGQDLSIIKCSGKDRNGSGIACILDDTVNNASWLLTGDAGYGEIGVAPRFPLAAVTVPHHGANMTGKGTPPARPSGYARLLYSFGPDNKHGKTSISHPTAVAFNDHLTAGWGHGTWSAASVALSKAGGDVLATATNPPPGSMGGTHLDGAAVGWCATPSLPLLGLPCSAHGMASGCTTDVVQT